MNVTNITYVIEEVIRGASYGFAASLHFPKAALCFEETDGIAFIIEDIIKMIQNKAYNFMTIAGLLLKITQWAAIYVYTCPEAYSFIVELNKYIIDIRLNPTGYLLNLLLNIIGNIHGIILNIPHIITHFSRGEYFEGADYMGTLIYDVFFKNVRY